MVNETANWRDGLKLCSDHVALCKAEFAIELDLKSGLELRGAVTRRCLSQEVRTHAKPKVANCQHSKSRDHPSALRNLVLSLQEPTNLNVY